MQVGVAHRSYGLFIGLSGSEKLLRGFAKLGLGEIVVRVSRILTAIVLARCLEATELGIAATAIACFELVRVLANNGIGQSVIRAREEDLAATCNTAFRVAGGLCLAMVTIQLIAGFVIARLTGRAELFGLIACLAASFIFLPWGLVQSWLLQRDYRMGTQAGINALQVGSDNLLTALLAMCGAGAWAIVLPKLLTTPIWLVCVRRAQNWAPDPAAGNVPYADMLRFSAPVVASELLVAVRFNVDKMLVGAILGLEALGIYYFAFSAGYGLSLVLTSALATASYPHLAEARLSTCEMIARFD